MKSDLVYIVGLSRVGSTMLDLVLGSHPRLLGLGEVCQVLRTDMDRYAMNSGCSCGRSIRDCPVWGPLKTGLRQRKRAPLREKYRYVLESIDAGCEPGYTLVDSSKLLSALKEVLTIPGLRVKVIYLIRDVRAWTVSRLDYRRAAPQHFSPGGNYIKKLTYAYGGKVRLIRWTLPFLTARPAYYFWLWYLQNRAIKRFLTHHSVDYLQVAYGELALNPEATLPRIFRFLDRGSPPNPHAAVHSRSHIIVGNTKKNAPERRSGIYYDNRWMYRNDWIPSAALFPNIMRYNAREVYEWARKSSIWEVPTGDPGPELRKK